MQEISTSVPEITAVDEPLLSPTHVTAAAPSAGRDRRVRMLLGLFARRRGASMVVRQNVARQLEDWREDWGYSLPVVVMETLWNLAFVVASFVTLFWIAREEKSLELRVWICGYSMQCVVHVVLLLMEYRRRIRRMLVDPWSLISSDSSSENVNGDHVTHPIRWEMVNKVISYMWWLIGFICVLFSYTNQGSAPILFWLTMAFLAMDVFFAVIRFLFLCLLLVACCFCLPFIIAFLCYISREGPASEADIISLPKFKFKVSGGDVEQPDNRACRMIPVGTNGPDFSTERAIQIEDADCCICLCHYEDEEQLHLLPCNHHFHSTCIVKWLRVKASCPLCKVLVGPNEQVYR